VCTVVCKLFNAVRPDVAVFGQKDYQQLAVVQRMTTDLDLGVEVVGVPTVRESDGLARSSRNRRLEADQRNAAECIFRGLSAARAAFADGERNAARLAEVAAAPIEAEPLARLEYLAVNDARSLATVDVVTDPVVMSTAVWFGEVRLIDNVVLEALGTTP
jgi:pantoate--beta-alanine ligase